MNRQKLGLIVILAAWFAVLCLPANAAVVAVGKDFSLDDPSIVRVDVVGAENVGDPNALVVSYSTNTSCLNYAYDDTLVLNQNVRLAFTYSDGSTEVPIIAIDNGFYSGVDPACVAVNIPPVAVNDPYGLSFQGQNVLNNDTDVEGDVLAATLATAPGNGSVVLNSDGTFVYTPNTGFFGSDSFTYIASDSQQAQSNVATVSIAIAEPPPTNQPPVAQDDPFGLDYAGKNVLDNDSDPDLDPITASLMTTVQNGVLALNADGTFTYTPDAGFSGNDTFTYSANDGEFSSNAATVTLSVEAAPPENQPPVAQDDPFGVNYTGKNVLDNDSDPDGDTLTAVLVSTTQNGSLMLSTNGSFTYTPELGYSGPDSFTYKASDGEFDSGIALVSITVALPAENLPPIAFDDPFGGDYSGKNVLDNDRDPNNDELIAVLETGPEGGELVLNPDGTFTYSPYAGFSGDDSFTYRARDRALDDSEGLESNSATVSLAVDAEADDPDGVTGKTDADGTSVVLDASRNELQASIRIDSICPRLPSYEPKTAEQEDLTTLCTNLRKQGTTAAEALVALKAITPEELAAISKAIRVLSFSRFRNLGARIARVRGGSEGLSIAGLNIKYDNQQMSGSELDAMAQETMQAFGAGASADDDLRESSKWGLFARGDLNFGEQDDTELESGFDFDAQSLTLGADYRINDNLFAGVSFNFGQTDVDFGGDGGDTQTDNYAVSAYGSWYSKNGWYVDSILSYGWSDIETRRHIAYRDFGGEVDRSAEGSTDGTEYYVSANVGYNFNYGGFNFDPLVRFFYLDGNVDSFTESGAGGWDLAIDDQGFESTSLAVSGQASYTFLTNWGVITPYLRIEYTSEFEDSADGVRYRFANDPFLDDVGGGGITMQPDDPESSYLVYGAGAAAQFKYGLSAFVAYQVLGSYENLEGQILSFGGRWEVRF